MTAQLAALTSAVAVPCYYKHFMYLPGLMQSLSLQTRLPDEVVISLSQVELLEPHQIDALEAQHWPFQLTIIRRTGVYMEGANRTTAAKKCRADIVLCIDADDIPHPQRVEAVVQLFKAKPEAKVVLCGHAYCPGESLICDKAIPFYTPKDFAASRFELDAANWVKLHTREDLINWPSGIHNGSPSIRRSIMEDDVKWSDLKNGADLEFNALMLQKYGESYFIQLPLLHYYNRRSSGADVGR